MMKIGGMVLVAAAISLSACAAPAEATPIAAQSVNWEEAAQAHPELVAKIRSLCGRINASTTGDGADAATVKRLAQEYCPR